MRQWDQLRSLFDQQRFIDLCPLSQKLPHASLILLICSPGYVVGNLPSGNPVTYDVLFMFMLSALLRKNHNIAHVMEN